MNFIYLLIENYENGNIILIFQLLCLYAVNIILLYLYFPYLSD